MDTKAPSSVASKLVALILAVAAGIIISFSEFGLIKPLFEGNLADVGSATQLDQAPPGTHEPALPTTKSDFHRADPPTKQVDVPVGKTEPRRHEVQVETLTIDFFFTPGLVAETTDEPEPVSSENSNETAQVVAYARLISKAEKPVSIEVLFSPVGFTTAHISYDDHDLQPLWINNKDVLLYPNQVTNVTGYWSRDAVGEDVQVFFTGAENIEFQLSSVNCILHPTLDRICEISEPELDDSN